MLNLLSSAVAFEWIADWRFYLVLAAVICIAVAGIIVLILKTKTGKNYIKPYLISAVSLVCAVILSVIIGSFVISYKGGSFAESYATWVIAGVLIFVLAIVLVVCLVDRKSESKNNTVALVYAAVCIAMSFALSYVKFFKMPQGGSITLASLLPIALYSYIFGVKRGVVCCFVYGILQMIQEPFFAHPIQVILDYPLAFLLVGFTGVFKKPLKKYPPLALALGLLIGLVGRYFCHVISGSVFFAEYAPSGMNPWIYSLGYNSFVFIDGIIVMVASVALMFSKTILREISRIEQRYANAKAIE